MAKVEFERAAMSVTKSPADEWIETEVNKASI
jgi:hypothetical protein